MIKEQTNDMQSAQLRSERQESVIKYLKNKTDENLSVVFQKHRDIADRCARRYFNTYSLNEQDLSQEAYLSLLEALLTYKEEKSLFSTYAETCIRYRLQDYVSKHKYLYLSSHFKRLMASIRKERNKLKLKDDKEISIEQISNIAEKLNTSITNVSQAISVLNIRFVRQTEDGEDIAELYADRRPNAENQYIAKEKKLYLRNSLHLLNDREQTVIIKYYFQNLTFEKIGQELNLTKERVRQINKSALEKLYQDYKIKFNS